MRFYDTLVPYKVLEHNGIEYTTCRDFAHISRCKGLRQVIHSPNVIDDRFISLETPNAFNSSAEVVYHEVTTDEENRLDVIAHNYLGSSNYSWVIAYMNQIDDGYTAVPGQKLKIPKSITSLFADGEILAAIPPLQLNLGSE